MITLAFRNLLRRPLRSGLTLAGLAAAMAILVCLTAFGQGYRSGLVSELDRMGLQLMLVPLGCPYDAAARVLKGKTLENSLPESALQEARRDPAVKIAAPMLMAAIARPHDGRTDMWVGLDRDALQLKPWWKAKSGQAWFPDDDSVILGSEAAEVEMRAPGDKFFSPETGQALRVAGILERGGTSDDSLFFVPLATAQKMFQQPGRITAVAIRLHDPGLLSEASKRLQEISGAQVVTLTEMMGTFLNLVGSVRTLLLSIGVIALTVSALSIFNTLLAAVVERTNELAVMRAIGASRTQIFGLLTTESVLLSGCGTLIGLALALGLGPSLENLVKTFVPLAPARSLLLFTPALMLLSLALAVAVGVVAAIYPAWRASQSQPAEATKAE